MRDYEELVEALRLCVRWYRADDALANAEQAADAIEDLIAALTASNEVIAKSGDKWISVEEPPDNDRNIFICHGSTDFKAPCIGHYDPGMKMFYEDVNWVSSPIYDAMFWCEMPKLPLPEPPKEATNDS